MQSRGLGRQWRVSDSNRWRPRHKHGKGLSHVEYYHLRWPITQSLRCASEAGDVRAPRPRPVCGRDLESALTGNALCGMRFPTSLVRHRKGDPMAKGDREGGAKKALTYDDRLVIEQGPLNCLGVEKARPGDVNLALLPFQDGCKIMRQSSQSYLTTT